MQRDSLSFTAMTSLSEVLHDLNALPEIDITHRLVGVLERLDGHAELAELEVIADEGFSWPAGQLNQLLWLLINFRVVTGVRGPTPGIYTFIWRLTRGEVRMNNRALARAVARGR